MIANTHLDVVMKPFTTSTGETEAEGSGAKAYGRSWLHSSIFLGQPGLHKILKKRRAFTDGCLVSPYCVSSYSEEIET